MNETRCLQISILIYQFNSSKRVYKGEAALAIVMSGWLACKVVVGVALLRHMPSIQASCYQLHIKSRYNNRILSHNLTIYINLVTWHNRSHNVNELNFEIKYPFYGFYIYTFFQVGSIYSIILGFYYRVHLFLPIQFKSKWVILK